MYRKIVLATDGSELAHRAVGHARQMAALGHADIVVLQVVRPGDEQSGDGEAAARLNVRTVAEELKFDDIGAVEPLVRMGDPAPTIVQVASSEGADLIVMSTRGRSGIRRMVLGSVADHVARHAKCPVLLVTAEDPD